DRAQERIVLTLLAAEVRARLVAAVERPADPAQIRLDEHAVAEHQVEERRIAEARDDLMHSVMEAEERVDAALGQEGVGEPGQGVDGGKSPDQRSRGQGKRISGSRRN